MILKINTQGMGQS